MATTTLDDLPGEVICLILQQVPSGKDLYAFLRASSKIYRAFSTSRDVTLWKIRGQSVVPEILVNAITAIKLRNMECAFSEVWSNYNEISALAREKLLAHDSKTSWPKDWITSADLSTLRQLQSAVEYFVDDFLSQSLPILFENTRQPYRDLSIIERSRLQRAFFRYDICHTLTYYPGRFRDDWEDLKTSRCKLLPLFNSLTPWEVEEIACVWQYVRIRLGGVFDVLGEKALDSIVSNPDQGKAAKDSLLADSVGVADAPVLVSRFGEGYDDFIFSEAGKEYQYEHVTFLASRPLPFLQNLFESGTDTQRRLVFKHQSFESDSLGKLLGDTSRAQRGFGGEQKWLQSGQPTELGGDELNGHNLAWLWCSNMLGERQYCLPSSFDLRSGGYVFWDEDRLQQSKMPRPSMNKARWLSGRDLAEEPSIERRLKDMKLPDGWDLVLVEADW